MGVGEALVGIALTGAAASGVFGHSAARKSKARIDSAIRDQNEASRAAKSRALIASKNQIRERRERAARVRARVRVAAAEAGTGGGGSSLAIIRSATAQTERAVAVDRSNTAGQIQAIEMQTQSALNNSSSQYQSPILAAVQSGLGVGQAALSIGNSLMAISASSQDSAETQIEKGTEERTEERTGA